MPGRAALRCRTRPVQGARVLTEGTQRDRKRRGRNGPVTRDRPRAPREAHTRRIPERVLITEKCPPGSLGIPDRRLSGHQEVALLSGTKAAWPHPYAGGGRARDRGSAPDCRHFAFGPGPRCELRRDKGRQLHMAILEPRSPGKAANFTFSRPSRRLLLDE